MRLHIAAVGKLKAGPEREIYDRYVKLCALGRRVSIGPLSLIEAPESRRGSAAERRAEEAAALLRKLPEGARLAMLDVEGEQMTSPAFAQWLARQRDSGAADLAFAIGGADGHGEALAAQSAFRLSLGPMTLPHGLARIVLAEQLYRAVTILCGHPYHRA